MDPKAQEELIPESFLTTDPKIIMRKPRPSRERYRLWLNILAAIAGGCLAWILTHRLRKFF